MFASIVTLINDYPLYERMVVNSLNTQVFQLVPILNPQTAAEGLNEGIEKADSDFIICCHQDVSFPENWESILSKQIPCLPKIGVVGTFGKTFELKSAGCIFNPKPQLRANGHLPCRAMSLDEHCLMFFKSSGLRFDGSNPHFHLYGADLCLQAQEIGLYNYIIGSGLEHLSPKGAFDETFDLAMRWLIDKWKGRSDIKRFVTMSCEVNFETGSRVQYF